MNLLPEIVFISAERINYSKVLNKRKTKELKDHLSSLGAIIKPIVGCRNNDPENAFMVYLDNTKYITKEILFYIGCGLFKQKSILFRDNKGNAYLLGITNNNVMYTKPIGKMNRITSSKAYELDSYTYFPFSSSYMGCA